MYIDESGYGTVYFQSYLRTRVWEVVAEARPDAGTVVRGDVPPPSGGTTRGWVRLRVGVAPSELRNVNKRLKS